MIDHPVGWQYLELTYDTHDRTRLHLDGVATTDGRAVDEVVAQLGLDGWEMVASTAAARVDQVLWFKRPAEAGPVVMGPIAADPDIPSGISQPDPADRRVVLVSVGNSRFDPALRARLIRTLQDLTGHSGWRVTRIVDKAPRVVTDGVTLAEAERISETLAALGATVEID